MIEIEGNWHKGYAFALHTLSSIYVGDNPYGHPQFDTKYSEMGDLVRRFKYQQDKSALPRIVELLDDVQDIEKFDYLVPIPPTDKSRPFQPVTEIALALGKRRGVEVLSDLLAKKAGGQQLKDVKDPEEREKLLRESVYVAGKHSTEGRDILLIDDLYRSGATLRVATELLKAAKTRKVCVLTMTRTRSNR
jgi:competence protein ComFC